MLNLQDYQVKQKIYESTDTSIYRAVGNADDRRVIVKTVPTGQPSLEAIARIHHEAKILNQLQDTAAPILIELITSHYFPILVIQDFEGRSLVDFYYSRKMNLDVFLKIAIQIVEQIGVIHQKQIIHKDINLSNIFLCYY